MVIACIDFSNNGHRLHLMQALRNAIIQSGHTAICITSDAEQLKNPSSETNPSHQQNAIYYSYDFIPGKEIKWSSKLNDISIALHYWKQYNTLLKKIETEFNLTVDIVIINYIDVFLSCLMPLFLQKWVFNYRWAGLYIHPRYMRMFTDKGVQKQKSKISDIDYLFTSDKCIGVGVFDNGINQALEYRLDKKVTLMPDITDISTDNKPYALVNEIKNKANGRMIIGTIGISDYTGIVDLIKLTLACSDKNYFFVFTGNFYEVSFNYIPKEEDKELLRNFRNNPPANCFWKECYLENEFEYNAVFNALDIIYLMYPQHYTSSNRLTKAAFFHKLVLAANQHNVGENVVKYDLGEVAEPGNIAQQLDMLAVLQNRIEKKLFPLEQWQAYYSLNNEDILQKQLKSLLNI